MVLTVGDVTTIVLLLISTDPLEDGSYQLYKAFVGPATLNPTVVPEQTEGEVAATVSDNGGYM